MSGGGLISRDAGAGTLSRLRLPDKGNSMTPVGHRGLVDDFWQLFEPRMKQ
jgi:hypothetical protein